MVARAATLKMQLSHCSFLLLHRQAAHTSSRSYSSIASRMRRSNVLVIGSFLNHAIRRNAKTASRLTWGTYVPAFVLVCIICTSLMRCMRDNSRTGGATRSSFSCVKVERREPEGLGLYTCKRGRTMKRLREDVEFEAIAIKPLV